MQGGYNPHCHPITSNHTHRVFLPFLYIFLNFGHLSLSLLQLSPIQFLFSLSLSPSFLFPLPSTSLLHSVYFPLPLSATYGRKADQAQGNGINFHSRLNLQSISLELNTLPPIRNSQSSISLFPRRHSPAIQRQPWKPCLTFWRFNLCTTYRSCQLRDVPMKHVNETSCHF